MNERIKGVIVAIHDFQIIYAHSNLNSFEKGMRKIEPRFLSKNALTRNIGLNGFATYVNPIGKVYHIYAYDNPNYLKKKK